MIAPSVVREIKRLLAETTYSQRKIARITGVSRGTIGAIAGGKRRDYEAEERGVEVDPEPAGPPRRCAGCGAMVRMPCVLCRTRELIRRSRVARPPARPEEPTQLQLTPDHQLRYEQIRRRPNETPP